jgi:hypothetical protein
MRYTNEVAWEIARELELPLPGPDVRDGLKPLIDAIRAERPPSEIEKVSRRVVPRIWNDQLEADALFELMISRYQVVEYLTQIDAALADLASRGARSMTARAIADQLALALAEDGVELD